MSLDHAICSNCDPEVTLCGAPRDRSNEQLVEVGTPHGAQPCPVCFAHDIIVCNSCGGTIRVAKSSDLDRAEASWCEYSTGFTWETDDQEYGERRMYVAGFNEGAKIKVTNEMVEIALDVLSHPERRVLTWPEMMRVALERALEGRR